MSAAFEEVRKLLDSLIGSKVLLVITSGLYKGTFVSVLQEAENGQVGVSHPTLKGAFLPTLRGTELLIKIEGTGGIYQGSATVIRSVLSATVPLLWLKLESALEKVQRRMFVRVPASIKTNVFFLEAASEEELPQKTILPRKEWFGMRISDMSLGGIGIRIRENLLPYCIEGGRYLLSMKIGATDFFIVGKLVKILPKKEEYIEVGFAYEGLSAFAEKIMGGYIRQQELTMRG